MPTDRMNAVNNKREGEEDEEKKMETINYRHVDFCFVGAAGFGGERGKTSSSWRIRCRKRQ